MQRQHFLNILGLLFTRIQLIHNALRLWVLLVAAKPSPLFNISHTNFVNMLEYEACAQERQHPAILTPGTIAGHTFGWNKCNAIQSLKFDCGNHCAVGFSTLISLLTYDGCTLFRRNFSRNLTEYSSKTSTYQNRNLISRCESICKKNVCLI